MSSNSQIDELCRTTMENDPESQLGSLCFCRKALSQNNELLNDYIAQSNYYTEAKADYEQYLLELSAHKKERDLFEYQVKTRRGSGDCTSNLVPNEGACRNHQGTLLNPSGDWVIDSSDDMGLYKNSTGCSQGRCQSNCALGWQRPICKLNERAQKKWMDTWDAQFPPPYKASEPIRPSDLVLSDVLCCDQNFSDIKGDQVQFNNVIQDCQFKINKDIGRTLKGEKFKVPSQPPVVMPSTSSTSSPTSSISSTSPTSPSSSWWDSNKSWLIPVIVGAVIVLGLVGYYAFGSMKEQGSDDDDDE